MSALLAVAASVYGLIIISAAGSKKEFTVQLVAIVIGICAYLVITLFDVEHLSVVWKFAFFVNLILLSSTLFFGTGYAETGNNSWIRFNIGGVNVGFQPAEIGKIIFIFTLAKHFRVLGEDINRLRGLVALLLHCALPVAFIYVFSKDDGIGILPVLFIIMAFAAEFTSGTAWRPVGIAASVPFLWTLYSASTSATASSSCLTRRIRQTASAITRTSAPRQFKRRLWGDGLTTAQYPHTVTRRQSRLTSSFRLPASSWGFRRVYNYTLLTRLP